ncbi:MAG: FAD-dependent oxidoreductase, partial [Candidatus Eisenbacteria bacterium]
SVMDDARLTIAVAMDAAAHGARIHTRSELASVRPSADGLEVQWRDRESGEDHRATARAIVNATGAWCDATRTQLTRMLLPGSPDPGRLLRPTRGVHLVYPALTRSHALLERTAQGRVLFVIPFAGRALVGTTEVEVDSPPSPTQMQPSLEEVRSLHAALTRVLPAARDLRPLAVFAGVRPLLAASGTVGSASREHRVLCEGRVLTVAGGKYTTFRAMARDVFRAAAHLLGREKVAHDPTTLLPLTPEDDIDGAALGGHAAETWARSLPDALRRRSTRWLDQDQGLAVAPAVADAMARRLGWSSSRQREELDHHEHAVHEDRAWLERALPRGA